MADNTTLPGTGNVVATDDIAGVHYQIIKPAFGALDTATLVSAANPFPVVFATAPTTPVTGTFFQATQPVSFTWVGLTDTQLRASAVPVSGAVIATPPVNSSAGPTTFTASDAVVGAPDGVGTLVSGASTAGSIVAVAVPNGFTAWTVLLKNWVNGTVYTEASFNSTNGTDGDWIDVKGRRTGTAPGVESVVYALVANGYYRGNAAGFSYFRCRFIGTTFPTVQISLTEAAGAVFLNSGIPGGSSSIGSVTVNSMGAVATTGDTGAKIITGTGATVANSGNKGVQIVIALGVVTGVTPTAVFKVQTSVDGGTTWVDLPGATTASLVATGNWGITIYPGQAVTAGTTTTGTTATVSGVIPRSWRMAWTISGTTPSFPITSITYNYLPN